MIDFSQIGLSSAVLSSVQSPSLSSNPYGSLSLGANDYMTNFAMANPAMSLIAQGYGTGRTYSLFGFPGMYGSIGLGAQLLSGLHFALSRPSSFDPMAMLWAMYNDYDKPSQTQVGGPSQAAAPQPPSSVDATGNAGDAKGSAGAPQDAAPAGKAKKKGPKKAAKPTPAIAAEFQQLLAKLQKAGSLKKMNPKDAKRLETLANKYPSLIPKEEPGSDAKKPDVVPEEPDRSAEIASKRKKLQDLESAAKISTLSVEDQALLSQLRSDPKL